MITISQRGSKKDFIDLYFLLKTYSLGDLFELLEKKYDKVDFNRLHIVKSLTYFKEAEAQPMPKMLIKVDWDEVKTKIVESVKRLKLVNK